MGELVILTEEEAFTVGCQARAFLRGAKQEAAICIVNRFGALLFAKGLDHGRQFTNDVARLKAILSSETGNRTSKLLEGIENEETLTCCMSIPEGQPIYKGGVPIYDKNNVLLGAIGISNLKQEKDEEYAIKAVEACGFVSKRE